MCFTRDFMNEHELYAKLLEQNFKSLVRRNVVQIRHTKSVFSIECSETFLEEFQELKKSPNQFSIFFIVRCFQCFHDHHFLSCKELSPFPKNCWQTRAFARVDPIFIKFATFSKKKSKSAQLEMNMINPISQNLHSLHHQPKCKTVQMYLNYRGKIWKI